MEIVEPSQRICINVKLLNPFQIVYNVWINVSEAKQNIALQKLTNKIETEKVQSNKEKHEHEAWKACTF